MLVAVIGFTSITTSASEEHKDEIVSMSVEMAKQNSIETVAATSGVIHNEEVVYGKSLPILPHLRTLTLDSMVLLRK